MQGEEAMIQGVRRTTNDSSALGESGPIKSFAGGHKLGRLVHFRVHLVEV